MDVEIKGTSLVVTRGGQLDWVEQANFRYLRYQYTDSNSPDGLSAWLEDDIAQVVSRCKSISGGFRQQALNRLFAQAALRHKASVVLVVGLEGASLDIPRVASLMGLPALMLLNRSYGEVIAGLVPAELTWLQDSLLRCELNFASSASLDSWTEAFPNIEFHEESKLAARLAAASSANSIQHEFDYSTYEFCLRDHPLLMQMQQNEAGHFDSCKNVLDLGCGAGIFLQLLSERGIKAKGVERDPKIAEYGRGMGLDITTDDALEFLAKQKASFDGIYCSHFVEHLPVELVQRLLKLMAEALEPGGVLLLAFPDPESIRSQLFGFWRDPEHVRFYHPELITTFALALGLECEWSSYDAQPHQVHHFEVKPEPLGEIPAFPKAQTVELPQAGSLWERVLDRLGVMSKKSQEQQVHLAKQRELELEHFYERQRQYMMGLTERTESLWKINQTWAWNDNVSLKLRKPK